MINVEYIENPLSEKNRWRKQFAYEKFSVWEFLKKNGFSIYNCVHSRKGLLRSQKAKEETKLLDGDKLVLYPSTKTGLEIAYFVIGYLLLAGVVALAYNAFTSFNKGIKPKRAESDFADSPSYGWDGIRNTGEEGIPIPVIYGKNKVGGNYINTFVRNENGRAFLYILISLGEGKLHSIGGQTEDGDDIPASEFGDLITVDGNPFGNLRNAYGYVRLGTDDQEAIPGFDDIHNLRDLDTQLIKNAPITVTTTDSDVEKIALNFTASSMIEFDDSGKKSGAAVEFKIEYKLSRDSVWTLETDEFEMSGKTLNEVRATYEIDGLTPGRYDVRVTRLTKDSSDSFLTDTFLTGFDEIKHDFRTYPNIALLGIKIRGSNQISGSVSEVLTIVEGLEVDVQSGDSNAGVQYTNNPIWCVNDSLHNVRYGLGRRITEDLDDLPLLQSMADHCDELVDVPGVSGQEKRYELDIILDSDAPALETLMRMCESFMCFILYTNAKIKLIIDREEEPVRPIGMGAIVKGSFNFSYIPFRESYNVVEVQYMDAENNYDRIPTSVEDGEAITRGDYRKQKSIFLPGIKRIGQATRVARRILNQTKHNVKIVKIKTGIGNLYNAAGDIVEVAHTLPAWGLQSGRVYSGSVNDVALLENLDVPVLSSGESLIIKVIHPDDTFEERTLVLSSNEDTPSGTLISVDTPFITAPQFYDEYVIGLSTTTFKPFRIMSIKRLKDFEVEMVLQEYNVEVYSDSDDPIDVPNYTNLPDPRALPNQVTNLILTSTPSYDAVVTVSFNVPDDDTEHGFWDHAEIWIGQADPIFGVNYFKHGESDGEDYEISGIEPGTTLYVKVVSVSRWGVRADFDDAPYDSILVRPGVPPQVTGLELEDQNNDTVFTGTGPTIVWKETFVETALHPASEEPLGASHGIPSKYFRGYIVETWTYEEDGVTPIKRRSEFTRINRYNYSLQMNREDHVDSYPRRNIGFVVYALDTFNQLSEAPGTLVVTNEVPAAVANTLQVEFLNGASVHTQISYDSLTDADLGGYIIQSKLLLGPTWEERYRGLGNSVPLIYLGDYDPYHIYRVAAFDVFYEGDEDDLNWTTITDIEERTL